jgi:branched-chain amino acid aminotransferase
MAYLVYLNGEFKPLDEACISVTDYGFLFGYALFETMHAYHAGPNGAVFRLEQHLDRLAGAAGKLGITLSTAALQKAVNDTVRINRLQEARVRLTVSAGDGNPVFDLTSCRRPAVVVIAIPHQRIAPEIYQRGYRIAISNFQRDTRSPVSGVKKTDYMENILACRSARESGADDAVLLNEKGNVTEGTTNNIFIVKHDIIKTPPPASGILPGITRNAVLELASTSGLRCEELDFDAEELAAADEIFLTSSMMEIMPVTAVNGKPAGRGKPGAITTQLMKDFKALVQKEMASLYK